MRARALLAVVVSALLLLAGFAPASAHEGSESETGALEVKARPAVARVGTPVHVRAEYDLRGDDDDDDEDESDDVDEVEDDVDDDDEVEDDDDEVEDDVDDDDDTDTLTAAAGRGDDDDDDEVDDDEVEDDDESDDDCPELEAASDDDGDDDCDDDADEDDDAAAGSVTFTIDFGDDTEPATMALRGDKRGGHKVKAAASHAYEAEGDYAITIVATPETGDPVESTVTVSVGRGSARLEGSDRIETALRISRDSFDDGSAGAVLLARYDGFADALASATLALAEQAPVLLVPTGDLPDAVLEEIERVLGGPGTVYLLGGEAAIAPAVADELTGLGHTVQRIAGDDRVATSVAIAQFLVDAGAEVDEVVLASATTFPDALAGAAYAADEEAPVLLTAPDVLSPAVHDLLMALGTDTDITVVGGTAGVSDAIVESLTSMGFAVQRLAGDDRYDTAVEIARAGDPHPTVVVIATGTTFPDALAGGAYAGRNGAPLLLVGDELSDALRQYLADHAADIKVLVVLGGGGAVPQPVMEQIEAALSL